MHQIRPTIDPTDHSLDAPRSSVVPTCLRRACALILLISLALGFGHAQSGGMDARTVRVEPSGVDDTAALQDALEACRFASSGCNVELAAGSFKARPLLVFGFRGALRGPGKDTTVIEALPGIDVVDAEPAVIAVAPTTTEPWPFLVTFVDGDVEISDLTLRIGDAARQPDGACSTPNSTRWWRPC